MLCVGAAGAELPWPRLHCPGSQCLLTDGCLGRAVYRCTVHCTATCSLYTVHLVRRKRNCWAPGGAGSCDGQGRMHRRPWAGNRRDLGIWDQWPGWRRLLLSTDTMTTPCMVTLGYGRCAGCRQADQRRRERALAGAGRGLHSGVLTTPPHPSIQPASRWRSGRQPGARQESLEHLQIPDGCLPLSSFMLIFSERKSSGFCHQFYLDSRLCL